MKKLITYYSRANENYTSSGLVYLDKGNTEIVAEMLKNYTKGDIFKIEQENEYSENYTTCTEQAKQDLTENARPALKKYLDSIEEYDEIFLCYPNYWGTMPMAVWTFLEKYDFSGKIIHPLCTHEGSGLGKSIEDLKTLCPTAIISEGLAVQGSKVLSYADKINVWADKNS